MSFHKYDFFEGTYQLREELESTDSLSRWSAIDYSNNGRKEVVVDLMTLPYDENLSWIDNIPGLVRLGQSKSSGVRFFVWEQGKEQSIRQLSTNSITDTGSYVGLLDSLQASISANEELLSTSPEYWQTGTGDPLVFYRKQISAQPDSDSNDQIFNNWKEDLGAETVNEEVGEPIIGPTAPPDNPKLWRLAAIGIVAVIVIFIISTIVPPPRPLKIDYAEFDKAIKNGIDHVKDGDYVRAVEFFKTASSFPTSDITLKKLDSLGKAYDLFAASECARYKRTQNPELFFIPNQYYHYSSILTNTPQKKCE